MATTKTQIVNRAFTQIGARHATNVDTDDTPETRIALNVYDMALENILTDTLWTFAKRRKLLAATLDTVPFNTNGETLGIVYQRPADALRIFEVSDVGADWYEEEDKIVSDTAGLGVIYTFLNKDPATYKPYFATAFSDLLAYEMCYAILNSPSKAKDMFEKYESLSLPKAKSENAQTGKAKEMNDDYWLNARLGGPNVKEFG